MKRFFLALLALLPTYALAQIPDCSPGLCAGVSVPAFACKSGQKYTQLDAPGTNFSCTGIPPHWVQDGGATLSLTTTGNTGPATLSGGALNIPQYTGGFSPLPTMTIPLSANFSWLNPNSYAVTNTDKTDRLLLLIPGSSGGVAFMQTAALPSAPYTIDVAFSIAPNITTGSGVTFQAMLALKNSGGGALRAYGPRQDAQMSWYLADQPFASVTSPSAISTQSGSIMSSMQQMFFFRITDDGTNRKMYFSNYGKDYELWLSQASGTGLSPDRVGLVFYNNITSVETVSVYHWLISNSVLPQYAP